MKKLGLLGLSAIVFGSVIGAGIFNIAQNLAVGAGAGAVIAAWLITAAGMLLLVLAFKMLADARPDLNAGIYQYAQVGFGNYVGFNIAWGYWLCAAFGNVAYALMLNDAIGVFWPALLQHRLETFLLTSALLWAMYAIVVRGVHSASMLNSAISFVKFGCIGLIIVLLAVSFRADVFEANFWGNRALLGSIGNQVKSSMMVTLWCFIGIEGAVVMSARARKPSDVGKASIIGFALAWLLYLLVSALCYGVLSRAQMAGMENPSVAYVLKAACGDWCYYFIIISVIFSLGGGWVAWTLLCSQVPYEAARVKIMPRQFAKVNKHQAPARSLLVSTCIMEVFIALVMMSDSVYLTAIQITGMMVLPAYFFSGLFLWKASLKGGRMLRLRPGQSVWKYRIVGILCTIYCAWLMYAGGLSLLMCTSLFYIPGTYFYMKARRQAGAPKRLAPKERIVFAFLCLLGVASLIQLAHMLLS